MTAITAAAFNCPLQLPYGKTENQLSQESIIT